MAGKRRALFLSPEAPYPPIGGGAVRSASILEYLSQHYLVDVILFGRNCCPGANRSLVLELPCHRKDAVSKALRNFGRLVRGVPPLIDRFSGFGDRVADFVAGQEYAVSVVEHFWCAAYHAQIAGRSEKTILDLHNIESDWYSRCAARERWPMSGVLNSFGARALEMERTLLPRFPMLLATSDADAARLLAIAPAAKVFVCPNTIPRVPEPDHPDENAIVFAGNMEYLPNVQAVCYFLREVWPLVRRRHPELRWRLVGKNPHAVSRYVQAGTGVDIMGPVDDAVTEIGKCKVGVVPVLSGSGTRLKILEMWAAGIPVVSTNLGAEGLEGIPDRDILIADRADEFTAKLDRLLSSAVERSLLGKAGRELYERSYTWQSAWSRLEALGI